jgi:beta-phosphoglucomutase
MEHYKAVLFDMDGVITDSMPYHFEAWRIIFAELAISVTREEILKREGEKGDVTLLSLLAQHGKSLPKEDLISLLKKKEEIFRWIVSPRLFDGAKECVEELYARGTKLALVTGTSGDEAKANIPAPILSCFHALIPGDLVTKGKPDPEPYRLALQKLSVSAEEALVIENAPYGIRSAKGAGIFCIALTTSLPATFLQEADLILRDLKELREVLLGPR